MKINLELSQRRRQFANLFSGRVLAVMEQFPGSGSFACLEFSIVLQLDVTRPLYLKESLTP